MNSIIDYIGSMVTGGLVFVMMLSFYFNIGSTATSQTYNSMVQADLASITQIIDYDFEKVGFCMTDSIKVSQAESDRVTLRGFYDKDAALDSVQYYLGDSPPGALANPNSRILYRSMNGVSQRLSNNGVTGFRLTYYDATGAPTIVPKRIRSIHVALTLESSTQYDSVYTTGSGWTRVYKGAYYERRIRPQNLR